MTTSLQELIDDSIFISTEHQARLAELSQGVEWDVDFSVPSFTLQSDPPVVLTPHLLGTDSAERGSWVWSWQELGHFPSEVVAAAVQSRESGARADVDELITDELPTQDGLARQLTLATKSLTGVWAHYPARVGKQVTAWLLLEGPELELEPISLETMMRVIAEALQTGTAVDHNRALDSYAKLRGMHIEWDTDATCVISTRDGAQRFWFEDHQVSGVEPAESTVGEDELARLEQEARTRREALAADRSDAQQIAEQQAAQDTAAREAEEATRREATAAADSPAESVSVAPEAAGAAEAGESDEATATQAPTQDGQEPLPAELSREDLEAPVPGTASEDLPYDQEPRRDIAPGEVTTTTVPSLSPETDDDARRDHARTAEQAATADREDHRSPGVVSPEEYAARTESAEPRDTERPEVRQPRVEEPATARPVQDEAVEPVTGPVGTVEEPGAAQAPADREPATAGTGADQSPAAPGSAKPADDARATDDQPADAQTAREDHEQEDEPRKKGFFSRFFGL